MCVVRCSRKWTSLVFKLAMQKNLLRNKKQRKKIKFFLNTLPLFYEWKFCRFKTTKYYNVNKIIMLIES